MKKQFIKEDWANITNETEWHRVYRYKGEDWSVSYKGGQATGAEGITDKEIIGRVEVDTELYGFQSDHFADKDEWLAFLTELELYGERIEEEFD